MTSEGELELYRTLTQSQQKYTYFLLAAAAAGIAFAVRVTSTATLRWSLIPLALAVPAWAASFAQGCFYVIRTQSNMSANAELLRVQRGEHPDARDPQLIQVATSEIKDAIESNAKKAGRHAKGQLTLLAVGAALFLSWHVLAIALRS